jgi:hypothetical protein
MMAKWLESVTGHLQDWEEDEKKPPCTCPCGYQGTRHDIVKHRNGCLGWSIYVQWTIWKGEKK